MTILAFEFSSERRSVALARGGIVLSEAVEHTASRGTNAFGLVENVLAAAKVSRAEIEVVAVGLGPGSYTGVRVGVTIAMALGFAWGAKVSALSAADFTLIGTRI